MRNNQPVTQREFEFPDDATLMSTTDANSYIQYANAAFIQVSGFSPEEIEGQPHNVVRAPCRFVWKATLSLGHRRRERAGRQV
ncbi:PAS domain S-box protein, partial [Burkholderia vietnamiensis]|uniref:PAS domain S-box protein n=1 Tax=Burkholderia vietnamiensis TaxID=60552 RepID=UPI001E4EB49C